MGLVREAGAASQGEATVTGMAVGPATPSEGEPATRLVTLLHPEYPANLRTVTGRPAFLFLRGALVPRDWRAVSVVGTRRPSALGCARAVTMAQALVEAGYTVVSGLARGIDTQAHQGALQAGGRTVAVLGTGIERTYPPENVGLAERIARSGALVSQFWPTAGPSRVTFPMRNRVSAGLALATVVVEAATSSGAGLQARLALGQGRLVVLLEEMVEGQEWARSLADRDHVAVVEQPGDLVSLVDRQAPPGRRAGAAEQLRLL